MQVIDLLSGEHISIRRDTGELVGSADVSLDSLETALQVLVAGNTRKRFAATAMNDRSSRSHSAFIIQITQTRHSGAENEPQGLEKEDRQVVRSQLHLVDLAGEYVNIADASLELKKQKVS
jgi:hypothetical protein